MTRSFFLGTLLTHMREDTLEDVLSVVPEECLPDFADWILKMAPDGPLFCIPEVPPEILEIDRKNWRIAYAWAVPWRTDQT